MNRLDRPSPGQPGTDHDAVSSIVAAVLLFALFVTAFTLWGVGTLPQWVADREEAHAEGIRESYLSLQAGLDALSAADSSGPTSVAFDLGPAGVPLLQPRGAQGELGVVGDVSLTATFTGESVLVLDGVARIEPDQDVEEAVGGVAITDIIELDALVVLLSTVGVGNDDEAWVEVVADDGDDTVTARITHGGKLGGGGSNVAGCLNSELRLEVTVDVQPVAPYTTTQALLCELGSDLSGYTVDLGQKLTPFAQGTDRLDTPYRISFVDDEDGGSAEATASFGIAYTDSAGFGGSAGSGQAADIEIDESGPALAFEPNYQEYLGPDASWQLGGLVLDQPDGAAIQSVAGFSLSVADGVGQMEWTIVDLAGSGGRGGDAATTVHVRHGETHDLVLLADGASFTITSPEAAAWRAFFADRTLLGGATGSATVGGSGQTATLTLATTADVTEWVLHLRVVTAELTLA